MAKTIVLIRHGKAQDRSCDLDDFDRELTQAGIRALKAWLPRTARLIAADHPANIELWASPAIRALQTAEIMADVLAKQLKSAPLDPVEMPYLWELDLDAFFEAVASSESDTIVAVGHNPFMEDACARVCGQAVPMSCGCAVGVRTGETDEGRMLWAMQGPETKRWATMVELEQVVDQAVSNVEARRDAFFADPQDVEAAHKYRVSIRTIRGLLDFIRPYINREQFRQLKTDWKELVGCTSRLREYDVLAAQVITLEPRADTLLEACAQARERECNSTLAILGAKPARKRLARACESSRRLTWKRAFEQEGLALDAVPQRFEQLVDDERARLAELNLADAEMTHEVRKQAKQVRYAATYYGELIGPEAAAVSEEMKAEQDRLGAICDARVNIDIIDEFAAKDLPEEAQWALSQLKAQNESFLYTTLRENA